ncbi:MAG: MFS transporter [Alphaproteobacteria bacterium]
MTAEDRARFRTDLRRRFAPAVAAMFAANGIALASWLPRLPEIRTELGLSYDELGFALFGLGAGGLIAMPVTGWLIGRVGSRAITRATSLLLFAILPALAFAPRLEVLALIVLIYGAISAAMDVAMNAQAAFGESHFDKPILSRLHGTFSIGTLIGAASSGAIAEYGVPLEVHLLAVAAVMFVVTGVAGLGLLPDRGEKSSSIHPTGLARPTGALWIVGLIAFCVLLLEGAITDWSAIYLRDAIATGPGIAAAGFAAFALTMSIGRLAGDWLVARTGAVIAVRAGGLLTALGAGAVIFGSGPAMVIAGFALAGAGLANTFPIAIRAAARTTIVPAGIAIAAIATSGYTGFLVGPPIIGLIAERTGLRTAFALPVLLGLVVLVLARWVRAAER